MSMSCEHFFHPANCPFCRDEEIKRLRAELIEERRTATRLLDDHARACVRAEQAEDRAEKAERERDALRFTQTSGTYAICAKHPRIFSPDKRMPCPACERDTAIAAKERAEAKIEHVKAILGQLTGFQCEVHMRALFSGEIEPQEVLRNDD